MKTNQFRCRYQKDSEKIICHISRRTVQRSWKTKKVRKSWAEQCRSVNETIRGNFSLILGELQESVDMYESYMNDLYQSCMDFYEEEHHNQHRHIYKEPLPEKDGIILPDCSDLFAEFC